MPGPRGSRANEQWTEGDYAELVELLRDGLPIDDIATNLGRGRDAVLSRCQQLLPAGQRAARGEADLVLRLHLMQHPDDDCLRRIRHDFQRSGRLFWDQAADAVVRGGWDAARPLAELVAATGASELQVATRLVELGLAARTTDVAARLGSEPGGTLDVRARL